VVPQQTCQIDDGAPLPLRRPRSVEEACQAVRQAIEEGQAIYPVGGGTMLALGRPPGRPGVALDTRGLDRVVDYPARDMTITGGAGITLAELQRLLASEGQRLPVDVPRPDRAALGGALAVNASGPRRFGCGTFRDYVLGIHTVNDEGQEVKAGGRVVKNVAGYDLCKLHVGALGTLGVITQVTLKLRPLPEAQALITFGCDAARLADLLDRLHASRTRPVCVDLLNAVASRVVAREHGVSLPEAPWVLAVGFEGNEASVGWQVRQLIAELSPAGIRGLEARAARAADPLWAALVELTDQPESQLGFKANMLHSVVADFCLHAERASPVPLLMQAHAGSGIVRGHASDLTLEAARAMLKEMTELAVAAAGNVVLTRCPTAWKREMPVWGAPRGDLWLMRQVKEHLDPRGLFNPGRFLDGI
jgi:glycolate oxidase FAD binding subunit